MKKHLRQILSLALALCFLIVPFSTTASALDGGASPRYNQLNAASCSIYFSSTGVITFDMEYVADSSLFTRATVTCKVEKKTLGIFWSDVEEWTLNHAFPDYEGRRSFILSEQGTYRATATFKIYGTGGSADTASFDKILTY